MARRKKKNLWQLIAAWLKPRPKVLALLVLILICLVYAAFHSYRVYADNRKFSQARTAIDTAYADIVKTLGQPDNITRLQSCDKTSANLRSSVTCSVETDFIYGVTNHNQANVILRQVQGTIAKSGLFRLSGKASGQITDSLVYDSLYHDALDRYSGPHHIACSVKYSYNTPDEVTLSLSRGHQKPLEVFFACSAKANHLIYAAG
ncbi:MAG TPA: hypothetical protein VFW90_01205 [Candidatus Saccharimonadales bacterium]|nr:hypothetical protein [Candidatus Saccharimonadales bacterium]